MLEIRLVSQYFTDKFRVNTDLFSKQSVPSTDAFFQDTDQNLKRSVFGQRKYRIKCIV